jgi:hypothetical protein
VNGEVTPDAIDQENRQEHPLKDPHSATAIIVSGTILQKRSRVRLPVVDDRRMRRFAEKLPWLFDPQ